MTARPPYGYGRTIYVNRLASACPALAASEYAHRRCAGGQYCRGDRVRGLEAGEKVIPGPSRAISRTGCPTAASLVRIARGALGPWLNICSVVSSWSAAGLAGWMTAAALARFLGGTGRQHHSHPVRGDRHGRGRRRAIPPILEFNQQARHRRGAIPSRDPSPPTSSASSSWAGPLPGEATSTSSVPVGRSLNGVSLHRALAEASQGNHVGGTAGRLIPCLPSLPRTASVRAPRGGARPTHYRGSPTPSISTLRLTGSSCRRLCRSKRGCRARSRAASSRSSATAETGARRLRPPRR